MVVMRLELRRLYIGDSLMNLVKAMLGEAVQEEEGRQTTVTRVLRFWEAMTVNKGKGLHPLPVSCKVNQFLLDPWQKDKLEYKKFKLDFNKNIVSAYIQE
ncbi:hypothetical protein Bca4012_037401 [Brassica carinata]